MVDLRLGRFEAQPPDNEFWKITAELSKECAQHGLIVCLFLGARRFACPSCSEPPQRRGAGSPVPDTTRERANRGWRRRKTRRPHPNLAGSEQSADICQERLYMGCRGANAPFVLGCALCTRGEGARATRSTVHQLPQHLCGNSITVIVSRHASGVRVRCCMADKRALHDDPHSRSSEFFHACCRAVRTKMRRRQFQDCARFVFRLCMY